MLGLRARGGSVLALSIMLGWAVPAHAQTDAAPPEAPPAPPAESPAPPPDAPPPSVDPPASDVPPTPPAAPPSAPPAASPIPAPPGPPAASAFPLPPPNNSETKPAPPAKASKRAAEPPAAAPVAPTPAESSWSQKRLPPTQPGTPPPPAAAEPVRHHEDEEEESVDQFKIGPVAGIGIPSIVSFGGTLKLTRYLGAGINIGLIPKVQLDYYGKATLSYQHYDVYGRLYPFGGGFFLGAGAGYATVDGTLTSNYSYPGGVIQGFNIPAQTATYSGEGSVRTLMLTALIGYFYTTSIGFSIGVDAGAQIPIAPSDIKFSGELKPSALANAPGVPEYKKQADDSVRSTLEKIGRTPLPTLNLRIGWIL